jgi:uncharacterized protein (DUF342 family)
MQRVGSGTLKTLGWLYTYNAQGERERVCKEIVIPLHKVIATTDNSDRGASCFIIVSDKIAYHVDISLKKMREILKEHMENPDKDFDTHPDIE